MPAPENLAFIVAVTSPVFPGSYWKAVLFPEHDPVGVDGSKTSVDSMIDSFGLPSSLSDQTSNFSKSIPSGTPTSLKSPFLSDWPKP